MKGKRYKGKGEECRREITGLRGMEERNKQ
jgi:hypothetical protein